MYSFNLVKTPTECAGCGTLVTSRVAGHYYQDPMCDECFQGAAPELAEEMHAMLTERSIRPLETSSRDSCANCGDSLVEMRFAGHHFDDPLCTPCLEEHAPGLAALLHLEEAVLETADRSRDLPGLLHAAETYCRIQNRLDADRPRKPRIKPQPDPLDEE